MTGDLAEVSSLSRRAQARIPSITGGRWLCPRSYTRTPIGSPYGSRSQKGEVRAYHVPNMYPDGLGPVSTPVTGLSAAEPYRGPCSESRTFWLKPSALRAQHLRLLRVTTLLTTVYVCWPYHLPDHLATGAGGHKPASRPACILTEDGLVPRASHRRITPAACLGRVRGQNPRSSPRANLLSLSLDSHIRDIVSHL